MSYDYNYDPVLRANVVMIKNICNEYSDDELDNLNVEFTYKAVREMSWYISHLERYVDQLEDEVDEYAS